MKIRRLLGYLYGKPGAERDILRSANIAALGMSLAYHFVR